ncbi:hypothetical protein PPL_01948 [Heterostelium album PN500]|uniref:Uncharacterized protein n=1 Tax=Heterostelium pallidum (strain ATCC 26659 / Pp 5 / PN500) TaxID=670386 RepID=D3B0Y1_HETP5|nr:hypothetical protein PPL_01948 [Heterostelium album PN500]EFA84955.1 hypothetical protein PPL_01948 [Heterostelium album PN500]|eukprot:XP_020437065.1 hypothetical protein PPL_01948 [Heterostelium album PN500]
MIIISSNNNNSNDNVEEEVLLVVLPITLIQRILTELWQSQYLLVTTKLQFYQTVLPVFTLLSKRFFVFTSNCLFTKQRLQVESTNSLGGGGGGYNAALSRTVSAIKHAITNRLSIFKHIETLTIDTELFNYFIRETTIFIIDDTQQQQLLLLFGRVRYLTLRGHHINKNGINTIVTFMTMLESLALKDVYIDINQPFGTVTVEDSSISLLNSIQLAIPSLTAIDLSTTHFNYKPQQQQLIIQKNIHSIKLPKKPFPNSTFFKFPQPNKFHTIGISLSILNNSKIFQLPSGFFTENLTKLIIYNTTMHSDCYDDLYEFLVMTPHCRVNYLAIEYNQTVANWLKETIPKCPTIETIRFLKGTEQCFGNQLTCIQQCRRNLRQLITYTSFDPSKLNYFTPQFKIHFQHCIFQMASIKKNNNKEFIKYVLSIEWK